MFELISGNLIAKPPLDLRPSDQLIGRNLEGVTPGSEARYILEYLHPTIYTRKKTGGMTAEELGSIIFDVGNSPDVLRNLQRRGFSFDTANLNIGSSSGTIPKNTSRDTSTYTQLANMFNPNDRHVRFEGEDLEVHQENTHPPPPPPGPLDQLPPLQLRNGRGDEGVR